MSGYNAYLESEIELAGPVRLVELLYQGALDAIRSARRDLAAGRIESRGRGVSKASAIVLELSASLDFERGGEIARNLAALYEYLLVRLTEGHAKASDEPLAEAERLLAILASAWANCKPASEMSDSVLRVEEEFAGVSSTF
jgi:flagellar secretion chaperone FliS